MLEIAGLKKIFDDGHSISFPDWKVREREHWLITGPSGSGKTTLLHLISGILTPTEGKIFIAGMNLTRDRKLPDNWRGKNIGIVFQQPRLVPSLSVLENVIAAQYFAGKRTDSVKALNLLKDLGVEGKKNKLPYEISQGEAQRVSIARAMINQPKLILADEPTASLDDSNALKAAEMLQKSASTCGAALIISTHDNRLKTAFEKKYSLNVQ